MSIIRHTEVTLESIISESNLIVEVVYTEPFEEEVPVLSSNETSFVKPFLKKGLVYQVKNILKDTKGDALGAYIRVPYENWKRSFSQHIEFYTNGPSKSYGVKTYKTEVLSMKDAEILFLHSFQNTYHLVAENAFESMAVKEQIERLIAMS